MVQEFADGPFIGRVVVERLLLGDGSEQAKRGIDLRFEGGEDVFTGDAIDVGVVIGRGFSGCGAAGHAVTLALDREREQPLLWMECRVSF